MTKRKQLSKSTINGLWNILFSYYATELDDKIWDSIQYRLFYLRCIQKIKDGLRKQLTENLLND